MSNSKAFNQSAPTGQQLEDGWLQTTPGERFKIRIHAEETRAAYTMLEMVADPRNGVPMHIHKNEDEHFILLEGTLHIAHGDKELDAPAGTTVTVSKSVPHAWCNLSETPLRMVCAARTRAHSPPGPAAGEFSCNPKARTLA